MATISSASAQAQFKRERALDKENERKAFALYDHLLASDPNQDARRELVAAGVPSHRIKALYPFDLADLAPGIKAAVTEGFLDALAPDDAYWNSLTESVRSHMGQYSSRVQEEARADIHAFIGSPRPAYNDLYAHIFKHLSDYGSANLGAVTMIYALLNTCWLVNRSRRLDAPSRLSYRRDHKLFIRTMQKVLPQLAQDLAA